MFDADGNQMVDKREFLVVSVTAQNRKIYVGFILFLFFLTQQYSHHKMVLNLFRGIKRIYEKAIINNYGVRIINICELLLFKW